MSRQTVWMAMLARGQTPPLRTGKLRLEPLGMVHVDEMVDVLSSPDLYTFTGGGPPTRSELESRYTRQIEGSSHPGETWHNWIVRDGSIAVGFVQGSVSGDVADVAWTVGVQWQGRGIAQRAAARMCTWLRDEGVTRIDAHIRPDHLASIRVAVACDLTNTDSLDEEGEQIWRWSRS